VSETKAVLEKISASLLRVGAGQTLILRAKIPAGYAQVFVIVPLSADSGLTDEGAFRNLVAANKVGKLDGEGVEFVVGEIKPTQATMGLSVLDNEPWSFDLGIEGVVFKSQRKFKIGVTDFDNMALASLDIEVFAEDSVRIKTFETDRYNLPSADTVTLSFTLSARPESGCTARINGVDVAIVTDAKTGLAGGATERSVDKRSDFTLDLLVNGTSVDTRQLRVLTFDRPRFTDFKPQLRLDGVRLTTEGLLGAYAHGGKLYVLRQAPGAAKPSAAMWSSPNGFDPNESQWKQVNDATDKPVLIPLRTARRPGVVFKDKLWFLGGDCCNSNLRGSDISYFNFKENYWFAGGDGLNGGQWPPEVGERMGHTLVAGPDDRLWVIGGFNQNGPCKDVWTFGGDGNNPGQWQMLKAQPAWDGRCLVGATKAGLKVFVVGGFAEPGGDGYNDILVYDHDHASEGWRTLDRPLIIPSGDADAAKYQFCACTTSTLGKEPQVLATYYRFEKSEHDHSLLRIISDGQVYTKESYDGLDRLSSAGLFRTEDYYRLCSTVFNGSIFIWSLGANLTDPRSMNDAGSFFMRRNN
jgi:galactose oxidase-like protein